MTLFDGTLFAAIILLAYTAQAVTGFGSTVLTVTLAALFLPLSFVMPVAVALNLPFCGWMIWRDRTHVDWRLLKREILPLMTLGVFVGAASATALSHVHLKRPLGAIVLVLALLELWRHYRKLEYKPSVALRHALVLGSGFMQGLYASGGPLLASAMAGTGMHRSVRRASLIVVWMIFNSALTVLYITAGQFTPEISWACLWFLPLTALGLWLGDVMHDQVSEATFRVLLNVILVISGAALLR